MFHFAQLFSGRSPSKPLPPRAQRLRRATAGVRVEALEGRQLLAAGDFDTSFNSAGYVFHDLPGGTENVTDVAVQADNKIVVCGYTNPANNDNDFFAARFNSDGSIDTGFGTDGVVTTDIHNNSQDHAYTLLIQGDGKILVGGSSDGDGTVVRYNADGSLDDTFGAGGISRYDSLSWYFNQIRSIAPYNSTGQYILGGGTSGELDVGLMNANGTIDTSFANAGETRTAVGGDQEGVIGVAAQPDGKIVAVGSGNNAFTVIRYDVDGSLDADFNSTGIVQTKFSSGSNEDATSMALQSDGTILVGGSTSTDFINWHFAIARYNSDGSYDTGFNGTGKAETQFSIASGNVTSETYAIALQSDGKIVASGYSETGPAGANWFSLCRYDANGTIDRDFGVNGLLAFPLNGQTGYGNALALQTLSGKHWIVMAGNTGDTGLRSGQIALARISADIVPPTNDNFAQRATLSGATATASGRNANATREAGEPAHAGYTCGRSVWWTWTAPDSGRVQIDTAGSNFTTLLGVYTGTNVAALGYIGSSKGGAVVFNAKRGQAYQIAVDGYNWSIGNIQLNVKLSAGALDEKQASVSAGWYEMNGAYQGKMRYSAAGKGANTAAWTFSDLAAGTYRVSANWLALSNAASNAPFSVYDGSKFLGTVSVNEKLAPKGGSYDGATWQGIGAFSIASGTLKIVLSNNANGYVLADGVRVQQQVLDDAQAKLAGTWGTMNGSYQGSMRYAAPGTGQSTATWTFSNLAVGTYKISALWLAMSNAATNAPFSFYDGTKLLWTAKVNEKLSPGGSIFDGATWQALSSLKITSGTLVVKLSNNANGYVLADGVRIERSA